MPSLFAVLMMRTPVHVAAAVSAVPRNVEPVLCHPLVAVEAIRTNFSSIGDEDLFDFLHVHVACLCVVHIGITSSFSSSSFVQQMYLVVTLNKSPLLCQPNAVGPRPG